MTQEGGAEVFDPDSSTSAANAPPREIPVDLSPINSLSVAAIDHLQFPEVESQIERRLFPVEAVPHQRARIHRRRPRGDQPDPQVPIREVHEIRVEASGLT